MEDNIKSSYLLFSPNSPFYLNKPLFLPVNLAGMQHGVLSVFVNFLALEPGIKKSKNQKPGGEQKSSPDLYLSDSLFTELLKFTFMLYSFRRA